MTQQSGSPAAIRSILVANRSEIAIRVMRAAAELGIRTVGIYSAEDRFALHRFKADESYLVGEGKKPLQAYLDIADIIRIAKKTGVDAIHPGYGFLSENPDFAQACADNGLIFIGPAPQVMITLGNKVAARNAAVAADVSVMPATGPLPRHPEDPMLEIQLAKAAAAQVGYPVMLKASWGGGGRGMRVIESDADLEVQLPVARREAGAAFGNDEVYLEKLVRRARHVEVQIMGDTHGNLVHLFERDCSVQRRNQKVVERAPAPYLSEVQRAALCESALRLGRAVGYTHAGTVEFLMDADTEQFYFIEVNPRIQVEHTVTEQVTGIDIVKSQIRISEGAMIGDVAGIKTGIPCPVPLQQHIHLNGHALQCRITTEDPENNFTPDYGRITAYRSAAGFGVRLDGGTAYSGAVITPFYDSLLVKVTASGPTSGEAIARMDRALREFRIRGVSTNLQFVENVINHPDFVAGTVITRFIDNTPELFKFQKRRDSATKLLRYIGDVTVNGHPDVKGRVIPDLSHAHIVMPQGVVIDDKTHAPDHGSRTLLKALGPEKFASWMLAEQRVLLTDTTLRDAHQSLFATRMRTADMLKIAPYYAHMLPGLFSMECWGGATFDVALRFLKEDPWLRLHQLRQAVPNVMFQMLLRSSNAVGYTNYPDNVVKYFVQQAARGIDNTGGVDLFRVFDSLNWVQNMRVAIDAVLEAGALCEGTVCYTADLFDTSRPYDLRYYVHIAKQLKKAGVHVLGIKDMAGICRPRAARELVRALKEETGLPIHFHTHDTSGIAAASVLAAIEAGADAVDGAMDSMSGLTSQPNLGSIVAALEGTDRDPCWIGGIQGHKPSGVTRQALREISQYWEGVRKYYAPFESDIRAGTSDVYNHEMPGGQYTNLREQARSMGLEHRWSEVSQSYADVNQLFGDIVKVTPTSKVVGDMAIFMVANGLSAEDVMDESRDIAFPESVRQLFAGELGFPEGGFPKRISKRVLKAEPPVPYRPGDQMPSADLEQARSEAHKVVGHHLSDTDLASYLMYPKVFKDYADHVRQYGDTSVLPTPAFFYGLKEREEIAVDLSPGKTLIVRLQGIAPSDEEGVLKVFFELNGQPRTLRIDKAGVVKSVGKRPVAQADNPLHIPAPMPGMVVTVAVTPGQKVRIGDPLVSIEAMKMETQIRADRDGVVKAVFAKSGDTVAAHDLLVEMQAK